MDHGCKSHLSTPPIYLSRYLASRPETKSRMVGGRWMGRTGGKEGGGEKCQVTWKLVL